MNRESIGIQNNGKHALKFNIDIDFDGGGDCDAFHNDRGGDFGGGSGGGTDGGSNGSPLCRCAAQ